VVVSELGNPTCPAGGYLAPFRTVDLKAPCPICHHPGVGMRKDGRFKLHVAATPRAQWYIPDRIDPDSPLARVAEMVRAERDGIG